ncbi:hypothetical protein AB1K62_00480 [Parasphingorhabdus sp. JC815]|uniref:hypothetical protein n=1 Tax=Parasphingorhabdus sp. JC815 TaxID=3232140 RepID=UPI003459341E
MAEYKNGFENWKTWHKVAIGTVFGFIALLMILVSFAPEPEQSTDGGGSEIAIEQDEPAITNTSAEAEKKAAILQYWKSFAANIMPCDEANTAAIEGLQNTEAIGIYAAFDLAKTAENRCADTWLGFNKLEEPEILGEAQTDILEKAKKDCGVAYFTRKQSLETLQKAIDGDMRPSVVQSYKEDSQFAQNGALACIATVMSVAMENGVTSDELKLD